MVEMCMSCLHFPKVHKMNVGRIDSLVRSFKGVVVNFTQRADSSRSLNLKPYFVKDRQNVDSRLDTPFMLLYTNYYKYNIITDNVILSFQCVCKVHWLL